MTEKRRKEKKIVFAFLELITRATPEELAHLNVSIGARRLGITPAELCRAFKTNYFCTAGDIVKINKQLAFEKLIINCGARNLKEALKILDIRSESNFIKNYKVFRHQTPGETIRYLKQQRSQYGPSLNSNQLYELLFYLTSRKRDQN